MKQYKYAARFTALMLVAALCLGGCGGKNKKPSVKTIDKFFAAAKECDYKTAGKYATDDVMSALGWDEMDKDNLIDVFYSSMGVSDEEVTELKSDKQVSEAVEKLADKMAVDVSDYKIKKSSYEEKDETATVKVEVTHISSEQLGALFTELSDEIYVEAEKVGGEMASEKSSSAKSSSSDTSTSSGASTSSDGTSASDTSGTGSDTQEGMSIEVKKKLIPTMVDSMIEKYDETEAVKDEWIVTFNTGDKKITAVNEP